MTEKELEAELVYRMYLNGADDLSFKPEIISGANASMPHGNPSDKPIAAGDALIMDFGLVKTDFGRICPAPYRGQRAGGHLSARKAGVPHRGYPLAG